MVEEMPLNMSCISSATENIMMEVPQKMLIQTFSVTLAYYVNSIIVFFKAPALKCIFYDTWSSDIFSGCLSQALPLYWYMIYVSTLTALTLSGKTEKKYNEEDVMCQNFTP